MIPQLQIQTTTDHVVFILKIGIYEYPCSCSRIIIDSMQDYQFYFGQKVLLEFGENW